MCPIVPKKKKYRKRKNIKFFQKEFLKINKIFERLNYFKKYFKIIIYIFMITFIKTTHL